MPRKDNARCVTCAYKNLYNLMFSTLMALGLGGMLGSYLGEWYFVNQTNDRERQARLRTFFGWLKLFSGIALVGGGAGLLASGAVVAGAVGIGAGVISIGGSRSGGRKLLK